MILQAENIVPFLRPRDEKVTVLVVEDDRLEQSFLEEQIKVLGHSMMSAMNGQEALDILCSKKQIIDVILMDRMMPVMDGLSTVRNIKSNPELRNIPVVMVTAAATQKDMQEGLDAGVFYYLTKPVDEAVLRSVLMAATREARQNRGLSIELKKHRSSFNLIQACKFQFSTLAEAECLSAFIANCFPEPERAVSGLAELMINAIEHGCLEIGYERKGQLLDKGIWSSEIERRQSLEENRKKMVEAVVTRKPEGTYVVITDPGIGFDWKKYMSIDPSRAGDNHGRGIAQANAISFDKLTYNETGNQVVAFVGKQVPLEW